MKYRKIEKEDISEIINLLKDYHQKEDLNYHNLSKRTEMDFLEILKTGQMIGCFLENKLIGFGGYKPWNLEQSISMLKYDNKDRTKIIIKEYGIEKGNIVSFISFFILKEYRKKGIFKILQNKLINCVKNYKYVITFLDSRKNKELNNYIRNGWIYGHVIKTREAEDNRYCISLLLKI